MGLSCSTHWGCSLLYFCSLYASIPGEDRNKMGFRILFFFPSENHGFVLELSCAKVNVLVYRLGLP